MGGLFICTDTDPQRREAASATAARLFRNAGLPSAETIEIGPTRIDHYPKHDQRSNNIFTAPNGDFILSIGTLVFGRQTGIGALRALYDTHDPVSQIKDALGNFVLILNISGKLSLIRDSHGTSEIYRNDDSSILSSSFLAVASCLSRRTIDPISCLEYIVGGVTLDMATPLAEVKRLGIGQSVTLSPHPRLIEASFDLVVPPATRSLDEHLEHSLHALRSVVRDYSDAFEKRLRISFSGGYDSRLLLALCRDANVAPELFVYGDDESPDVRSAVELAKAENLPCTHIDKSRIRPATRDMFPEMLRNSYFVDDGFSNFWMFCSDSETFARPERCSTDTLLLNGGGGEVFRNFYKTAARRLPARAFVRGFMSGYDPLILVDRNLAGRYEARLSDTIMAIVKTTEKIELDQARIMSLYPHLRCRSWFGRETSIDGRFGSRAMPYMETSVVHAALSVPLRLKHFGIFQAALIRQLDPVLARYPSAHGYSFDRDPPWRHRVADIRLYATPPSVRRFNHRIKKVMSGNGRDSWPETISADFLKLVIDPSLPLMSNWFSPNNFHDPAQFQRLCVLEYMFENLNATNARATAYMSSADQIHRRGNA